MKIFIKTLMVGVFMLNALSVHANDDKAKMLPEVVVTGQSEQVSSVVPEADVAKHEIQKTPGGVYLVKKEEVDKGRAGTPQDLLGWVPGLHVQQRDTASLESRISIRGSGLQRTFHLRGINLLQDGIPLNQADGSGDAQRFDPLTIDYTEVYRGGNALRYGASTLGGAINFVSPTGYTADSFQTRFEFGSFDYIRSQISSGQVVGPVDYYASISQYKQDGFREHGDQDNYNLFTNAGYKISDTVETRLYFTLIKAKSKLGGSLTQSQMESDPTQASASSISGNRKRDIDYTRIASKTTVTLDDERKLDLIGHWSSYELFHPIPFVIYQDDDDWGGEIRYSDYSEVFGHRNELLLGFGGQVGYIDDDRYSNSGGEPIALIGASENIATNLSLYGENRFYLTDQLAVVTGAQLLYATRDSDDLFLSNGDSSGKVIYRSVNPKAGLLYEFNESSQLYFNYNKSFEPPSFSEMSTPTGAFRPNKGQLSHTLEVGTRGAEDRFGWDVTYYYSWLDNELLSLADSLGNTLGTVNAPSETLHQGIELGANADIFRGILTHDSNQPDRINLRVLYNWNDFRFNGDPAFGDNMLPAFPEHFFKAEIMYEHPDGYYFGLNLESSFEDYPIDMANTFFADSYTIWGLKAGYRSKKGISYFFEAKNLSDEVYASSTSIVTNAGGLDTSAVFNPGSGRSYFGGIEYRW